MANSSLEQKKKTLFRSLEALERDRSDEDIVDSGLLESIAILRTARQEQRGLRNVPPSRNDSEPSKLVGESQLQSSVHSPLSHSSQSACQPVIRSVSAPEHMTKLLHTKHLVGEPPASLMKNRTEPLLRPRTSDGIPSRPDPVPVSAVPRPVGKRKRSGPPAMVPETEQIFRALSFYFFPNNDVHPARRMRINKAIEYGASWIKDWQQGITHVIVDKGLTYFQLLAWLELDSLPAEVVVVDELYPADCIVYRTLVEPNQVQYTVLGYSENKETSKSSETCSNQPSLELKPGKKDFLTRGPPSPSGVEYGDSPHRAEHLATPDRHQHIVESVTTELREPPISFALGRQDSFDEIIQEVRSLRHLPLDEEEDDEAAGASEDIDSDTQDSASPPKPVKKAKQAGNNSWQNTFQCMKANDGKADGTNPNSHTIEILEQMGRYYDRMQDHWRTLAYRRAVTSLKREKRKITSKEEAVLLPFVGERLAAKIEEIAWTNRLRRLENAQLDATDTILQTFLQIYGVGFAQASRWVRQGYRTLDDLLNNVHLTENQKIGIAHYEDFGSRIPRSEVTQHGDVVRSTFQAIDPEFEVIVGGSYRRGAATSGDIDCVITHPTHPLSTIRTLVLDTLVPQLFARGFLKATLSATTSASKTGSKWHGASSLPSLGTPSIGGQKRSKEPTWRRIDLLLVPPESKGAALIYFTGNDIFNRSIRLLASKRGMRLNQHGLFKDVMRGPGRLKITEGTLLEGRDEKRIFELLGVPWREPEQRIC